MEQKVIFDLLWKDYSRQNPSAKTIQKLFEDKGEVVANDHVAFRTFNDPRICIEVLAIPFIKAGYRPVDDYRFEAKKLRARHYQHSTEPNAPKVFISELLLEEFDAEVNTIASSMIDKIPQGLLASESLVFSGRTWGTVKYSTYEQLRKVSEYAAWLYVYGFRANHFTVNVNDLREFDSLQAVNSFLKENGFVLNSSGGEIKGAPSDLLEQSSVLADMVEEEFAEGTFKIPSCYYEFALRHKQESGELYQGFIASSADKIFESTDLALQINN